MVGSEKPASEMINARDYLDRNAATMPRTASAMRSNSCHPRFVIITSAAGTTERLEPELKFDRK